MTRVSDLLQAHVNGLIGGGDSSTGSTTIQLVDPNAPPKKRWKKPVSFPHAPPTPQGEGGWVQHPSDWCGALDQALQAAGRDESRPILALGFSNQQHTACLVDEQGCPLHKAETWQDAQASRYQGQIRELFGFDVPSGLMGPKLFRLAHDEREIFMKAVGYWNSAAYMSHYLTGAPALHGSEAGAQGWGFDLESGTINRSHLDAIHPKAFSLLPPVLKPGEFCGGTLREDLVAKVGDVYRGAFVAPGLADNAATFLGALYRRGTMVVSGGTSWVAVSRADRRLVSEDGSVLPFVDARGDGPQPLACQVNGASVLNAFADDLARVRFGPGVKSDADAKRKQIFAELDDALVNGMVAAGCGDFAACLPYLQSERLPRIDNPQMIWEFKGEQGLDYRFRYALLMQSLLFNLYKGIESMRDAGVNPDTIVVAGGVANSRAWRQMVADILLAEVKVPKEADTLASQGGALYALWCLLRRYDSEVTLEEVAEHFEPDFDTTTVKPDSARAAAYGSARKRFEALFSRTYSS